MEYLNEQQQVEQLKTWLKEYGLSIVIGVVLAILIVFGLRFYYRYEAQRAQQASMLYTTMINSVLSEQASNAQDAAQSLVSQYSSTPYASIARLWLAGQSAQNQDYKAASTQLDWVMQHAKMTAFRQVARLESAQISLQQNQPDQALQTLSVIDDKAYLGLIDEIRGDAYLQEKQIEKARMQYQLALKEIPQPTLTQPVLAMKLANLPVANAK